MHNTVFLVGRLASDPNYHEVGDGKKVSNMCLAVTRSYKNEKGEYLDSFDDLYSCLRNDGVFMPLRREQYIMMFGSAVFFWKKYQKLTTII